MRYFEKWGIKIEKKIDSYIKIEKKNANAPLSFEIKCTPYMLLFFICFPRKCDEWLVMLADNKRAWLGINYIWHL